MAIQGWILTVLYSIGLLLILTLGERRDLIEMGIPFVVALALAVQLGRCGMSIMRGGSRRMAYAGAILAAVLFLPLGTVIFIWVFIPLKQTQHACLIGPN